MLLEFESVLYELKGRFSILEDQLEHAKLIKSDNINEIKAEMKGLNKSIEALEKAIKKASEESEA